MVNLKKSSVRDFDDHEASSTTPLLKSNRNDVEHSNASSTSSSPLRPNDENDWNSKQNRENPRNWPFWDKWATVALVSFIELLSIMPSFMYAPNITDAQRDLGTSDDTLATFSLTVYLLGFSLGPLLFAPLSEMYGRAIIYRSCIAVFLATTFGCALSSSIGMLVAFRFLAGSFGAAPVAIGGAVVGDLFFVEERGTAMSVYQAGLIISAVIGPPVGGLIGWYLHWRWAFGFACILTGIAFFGTFIILRETHAPTLKSRIYGSDIPQPNGIDKHDKTTVAGNLRRALSRPLKLITRSPVVFSSCVLIFLVIGMLNVFLTLMSRHFQRVYGMTSGQSSIVYLGLALGFVLGSTLFGLTNDRVVMWLTSRHGGETVPEYRLPTTIFAIPVLVIGLLWYGWTLHFETPWILPIIGSGLAGMAITTVQLSITTYLVDSFDTYSASALAAITMARSVGGAILPLSGPYLFEKLGLGWGNSVLALMSLLCGVIPPLLYIYGARWRAMVTTEDL